MLIFPIRHHSPAAALQLRTLIQERRPKAVLVEAPVDAEASIPFLLDGDTLPPVAIYAYRAGQEPGSEPAGVARAALFPFCAYSPEYVALKAGDEVGAALRFCDVPAAVSLTWPGDDGDGAGLDLVTSPVDGAAGYAAFTQKLAADAGFDGFDAFWEAAFEQDAGAATPDEFIATLTEFGTMARGYAQTAADRDGLRERHMAAVAREVVAGGIPAEEIVLVCGAAHAAAIQRYFDGDAGRPTLGEGASVEVALIPFSYPRLSEQLGYGAGNRAPWFYQQVWELNGDYAAATRRSLVALTHRLREGGQIASLAQSIEADRLASTLAGMRGKRAPGVDEVKDASVACFGMGREAVVAGALREILIGQAVGRVTFWAGRTPLQAEFYTTTAKLRLPVQDLPREVLVHMPDPEEALQSVFLHRLVTAEIPFARELASGLGRGRRTASGGSLEQLGRARERWELCWMPATDARLVEQNAWGSTLAEACTRLLRRKLANATRIDEGSDVLLRLALCDLPEPFPAALARCEALAADSSSFPALARAAYHLDGLLAYGAARSLPIEPLTSLSERLFTRAAVHLPEAAVCADEAAHEVEATLKPLAELVQRGHAPAAAAAFWEAIERVAAMETAHALLRGLCLTLLEIGGRLEAGELARRLRFLLSSSEEAAANARLVAGVFSLHRATLVRNRAVIGAVTDFLTSLQIGDLIPLLPALRRSLGDLTGAERAYLSETLGRVLELDGNRPLALPTLAEAERARLAEIDAAVAATLKSWEERYGIA